MRMTVLVLVCLAIGTAIGATIVHTAIGEDDHFFLEKQRFLLEIVYRVDGPLYFEEWITLGGKLIEDKSKYTQFSSRMTYFHGSYKNGQVLRKGEFFSPIGSRDHFYQAFGLFHDFFYALDWDTLARNIVWARIHVNEGLFVYALNLAITHRADMKSLILPPIYEIIPQLFFASKYIVKAEQFNWDMWNMQNMLESKFNDIYQQDIMNTVEHLPIRDWKTWQWWKLIGLEEEFYPAKTPLPKNPMYQNLRADIKTFFMPVDYTRDVQIFNEDAKLSYFTEDIGWNAYWYHLNVDYSIYVTGKQLNVHRNRRGEWWIFNVQQILARYNAERLSHGMAKVEMLNYHGNVQTGYNPQLVGYNGNAYTVRSNDYDIYSRKSSKQAIIAETTERRIVDIIEAGRYTTVDGFELNFTTPDAIEHVGKMMMGGMDMLDRKLFGYWLTYHGAFVSGTDFENYRPVPNVLQNFETMERDPLFYQLVTRITSVYHRFKNQLPPYEQQELLAPGVEIVDGEVSPLETYFDLHDADISNLLNDKITFQGGKFVWDTTLLARQARLNHKPFNFILKVTSIKPQRVVVRSFYTTSFDEYDQKKDLYQSDDFIQLDQFVYNLVEGINVIKRSSKDFYYTIGDRTTYTELYKHVMLTNEGVQEFKSDITPPYCGFPNRIILSRGLPEGLPIQVFFMVTPYDGVYDEHQVLSCGLRSKDTYFDDHKFGYPFDRKIYSSTDFITPNMLFLDAKKSKKNLTKTSIWYTVEVSMVVLGRIKINLLKGDCYHLFIIIKDIWSGWG